WNSSCRGWSTYWCRWYSHSNRKGRASALPVRVSLGLRESLAQPLVRRWATCWEAVQTFPDSALLDLVLQDLVLRCYRAPAFRSLLAGIRDPYPRRPPTSTLTR